LVQEVPAPTTEVDFRVIVDRGSIEVFAAGGSISLTNLIFVDTVLNHVSSVAGAQNLATAGLTLQ